MLPAWPKMVLTLADCSSLVAACIRKDMLAKAMQLLDQAHSQGTLAPSDTYTRLLQHCCRGQHYQQATEIFLSMQAAGGEADHEVCRATRLPCPGRLRLLHMLAGCSLRCFASIMAALGRVRLHSGMLITGSHVQVLLAMFMVLEQCSRPASAAGLLQSCTDAGVPDMKPLQLAAMKCYARAGAGKPGVD